MTAAIFSKVSWTEKGMNFTQAVCHSKMKMISIPAMTRLTASETLSFSDANCCMHKVSRNAITLCQVECQLLFTSTTLTTTTVPSSSTPSSIHAATTTATATSSTPTTIVVLMLGHLHFDDGSFEILS